MQACDGPVESTAISMMLGKPATSVTLLMVKELTSNKNGNKTATDQQHSFRVDAGGTVTGALNPSQPMTWVSNRADPARISFHRKHRRTLISDAHLFSHP